MTDLAILSAAHLHAHAYADALAGMEDATLVGVADEDAERGRAFAADHDTEYAEADDLLAAVDGAVICSANVDHGEWLSRAADAGVDVLCEKPLATSTDAAEASVETAADAGVELGVAMPLRFSRPAREAKAEYDAGTLGTLRSVVGTNRGQMPGGWFVDPEQSGGGATMDHTVHIVDLIHWLTGERVAEVYAETAGRLHDIPVEDVNVLSMELESGADFSLDGSWSRPDGWHHWGDATFELLGDDGRLCVDCFGETFEHSTGEDYETVYWGDDPNVGLVEDFVDAVREGRTPETSGEEARDVVAVVEAAYESAERDEPVAVDY